MPNPIKYTTGSESDALVKGNFRIGTGSVGKGPSDSTGYFQKSNKTTTQQKVDLVYKSNLMYL